MNNIGRVVQSAERQDNKLLSIILLFKSEALASIKWAVMMTDTSVFQNLEVVSSILTPSVNNIMRIINIYKNMLEMAQRK